MWLLLISLLLSVPTNSNKNRNLVSTYFEINSIRKIHSQTIHQVLFTISIKEQRESDSRTMMFAMFYKLHVLYQKYIFVVAADKCR